MNVSDALRRQLAPQGRLRASINLGNPVLARRDAPEAAPYGVSIDLAGALAERLGVGLDFVVFDSASQSVDAVADDRADIGFFAIDPKRGETIAFTDAYLHIEGWYAVRQNSPITTTAEVDQAGRRVAVGRGSAYDLFLTRELRHAEIIRAPNPQAVTPLFVEQGLDVAAGVKQQLEMDMHRIPGLRLLPERFMVIRQAMGLAQRRGADAHAFLAAFVESAKANGFVANALRRHGIDGATVAPPTPLA
ncbi:ABC transporter substrate-binding protein [uncultured Propionivibrio sp.]|uniref:ABC transporter substrate-binding protein n=1 Tax=uncultured Propionivibrio sp. TaxID=426737 RepID=UPI0029C097AF|nr:ABC transporter substrate-binding protein [uncultured Propionivibrio sp.]